MNMWHLFDYTKNYKYDFFKTKASLLEKIITWILRYFLALDFHYGQWHPAKQMTKITNFASNGQIGLKIGQRCGFLPEITHRKF